MHPFSRRRFKKHPCANFYLAFSRVLGTLLNLLWKTLCIGFNMRPFAHIGFNMRPFAHIGFNMRPFAHIGFNMRPYANFIWVSRAVWYGFEPSALNAI